MAGISTITICFNNLTDLQKTCASVDGQSRLPDEHWVINGSTTPDIEQWLLHTPQPVYRKWINERDKGISDALNKGIQHAGCTITHLLHSGDRYASTDVLESVEQVFEKTPALQWISGNMQLIRSGREVVIGKPFDKRKLYRGMRSVSHPTWFVKKEVYGRAGLFNSEYKIAMDYDLMCRIADERRKIYESYFGFSFRFALWQLRLKLLHYLLQTSFGKWLFGLKKKLGLENF